MQEGKSDRHDAGRAGALQVPAAGGAGAFGGTATHQFYDRFSLEAKGKYILRVCDGTACHVRTSQPILEALQEHLGLNEKKVTSSDMLFTLETVACLGACGLAPVLTVNGEVHAKMTPEKAVALVESIRKEETK